jgi:uncharacterized repeat protein (TIGR01451 family)
MTRIKGQGGSRRQRRFVLGSVFAAVALGVLVLAVGSAGAASIGTSKFEIDTDANLVVNTAGNIDWLAGGTGTALRAGVKTQNDAPTGSGDDSFGQGTSEDDPVPTPVQGSVPPNKSDLKSFGVFQENIDATHSYLHLFWSRVQDPKGTTNMDFEFNKSQTPSSNGITPVRTAGDLLIEYHIDNGGTAVTLSLREWTGSVWGVEKTLAGKAIGSINATAITAANAGALGALSARTFGEASLDLAALFPTGTCASFGSAYVKSRSSDSFTAEVKDYIKPEKVGVSNCGSILVKKVDQAGAALAGAEFTVTPGQTAGSTTATSSKMVEGATGVFCLDNLLLNKQYNVSETKVPTGYTGAADQKFTPTLAGTCADRLAADPPSPPDLTFTNTFNPKTPSLTTNAGNTVTLDPINGTDLFDVATLTGGSNATGTISFQLYLGADCAAANLVGTVGIKNGALVAGDGSYTSANIHVTKAGQYHWIANYSGDANNVKTLNTCNGANEDVKVIAPGILVDKTVDKPVVHSGDLVTYTIKVTNTGDSALTNVSVTDDKFPASCNKTIGTLAAGASSSYTCTATITADTTNTATATGTTETNTTVKDDDDAVVDVISPSIEVKKTTTTPAPTVGGTVKFNIKVTNTGDTTLSTIVITDANAPGCERNPLKDSADGLTGTAVTLAPQASANYDCELANVPITYTGNTAKACGTDKLNLEVCDDDTVPVTPVKAKPAVDTNAGAAITLGSGSLQDTATLSGGYQPTGKITFTLYGPNDATCANAIATSTATVTGNANYNSDPFTPTLAGTYRWIANYSGDVNNEATTNACNGANENVIVNPGPSKTATAQSFIPQDSVSVTGFANPGGSATFTLFKNDTCTGTPLYSQTVTLSGSAGATSNSGNPATNGYTATGSGTWYWKVTYSGDANNQPSESACKVETFSITN